MFNMKLSILCLVYFFIQINGQRIAGGQSVSITEYPFAAALLSNGGEGTFQQACGGTIIASSAVLSAASCFFTGTVANPASWWRARVGSSSSSSGGTIYLVNRITVHPAYVATSRVNDLAVLRTTLTINTQPGLVQPASLVGGAYAFETNQPLWAIGWGAIGNQNPTPSEELRHVQFWSISQQTCANRYNALGFTVTDSMMCAGWLDVGVRGQCPGDAGSPLVDSQGYVVGVFSWAEGCANSWYPDINTRVSAYVPWIVSEAIA